MFSTCLVLLNMYMKIMYSFCECSNNCTYFVIEMDKIFCNALHISLFTFCMNDKVCEWVLIYYTIFMSAHAFSLRASHSEW